MDKCLLQTFGSFLHPSSPPLYLPRLQSVLDSVEIEATSTLGLPTCPAVLAVRPPYEAVAPKRQTTPQPCPPILPIEKSDLFRHRTLLLTVTKPKKSECSRALCPCPSLLPTGHPANPRGQETRALPPLALSFHPCTARTSSSQRRPWVAVSTSYFKQLSLATE